jgi:hypothetical protein
VFRGYTVSHWLVGLGLALGIVGYFGPWVGHRTAALTVTGFEMAEFAKFFPQVQGGTLQLTRALFYLPLVTAAILLALAAGRSNVWGARWIVSPVVAVLLVVALLPYSAVDGLLQAITAGVPFVLDPQYARQTVLVAVGVLLVLLATLAGRIATRAWGVVVALLALSGAVPALFQFVRLRPLVVGLYDGPLGLGWGLVACVTGFVLLLAAGILAAVRPGRATSPGT